jgi:hypothetical protein
MKPTSILLLMLLFLTSFFVFSFGSEPSAGPMNSVCLDAGGPGFLYSLSYERLLPYGFALRGGASFISPWGSTITTIPLSLIFFLGRNNHKAEFSSGITYFYTTNSDPPSYSSMFVPTWGVGYRYQPTGKRYFLRCGLSSFLFPGLEFGSGGWFQNSWQFMPWIYLGAGFRF